MKNCYIAFSLALLFLCSHLSANPLVFVKNYTENSENLRQAQESHFSTENMVKQVRGSLYPNIQLTASKAFFKNIQGIPGQFDFYTTSLELVQPIYTGGKLFTAVDLAKVERAVSALSLRDSEEKTKQQAWNYLLQLLPLVENLDIAKGQLTTSVRNLKIVKNKTKLGNSQGFEINQSLSELMAREISVKESEIKLKQIENEIKKQINSEEATAYINKLMSNSKLAKEIENSLQQLAKSTEDKQWAHILKNNRDLKMARFNLENLSLTQRINLGDDLPSFNIVASEGFGSANSSNLFEDTNRSRSFSINATIPLFSGLSSIYKRKSHQANVRSQEQTYKSTLRVVKTNFENLKNELKLKKSLLQRNSEWLKQARLAESKASKSYRNGQISFLQFSQVQQGLDTASSQYWLNWANYQSLILQFASLQNYDLPN